ncbi:sigma-70 family RNA polymerase sigma factor [Phytopseudomonas dryadis]|uniref:RNA polymerase subunit sigma-24 n=1 Tax=Phytopseudomonas dryadis TaxID=2487520 RepID=A0ABY1ZEC3_9GAMM|nr:MULTISPECIES: sigma-70 family RNA polymerase sigma factor [Pseudomonas]TBV08664.1 RNA polymerase subunit sigma-24 [Pseudomonas dryadis]TBV13901.1 RNA polymerase subunit sigma-24 [Pseudomonas sp. FRB 230]
MDASIVTKLELYLAHRAALVDYATPIVGCRARAEDVVQEAWLRFNGHGQDAVVIDKPLNYLYRIVRNLAFDLTRRLATERRQPGGEALLEELSDQTPGPEQQASSSDELRIVNAALDELPARTRQAFEMHRLGGHTLQHIAATLGISVGLAHQLVHQALCHCADRLEQANA